MSDSDMSGEVVVVTGANVGIGRATALQLARKGAKIILACRNAVLAEQAEVEIRRESSNDDVHFVKVDLSDLRSVSRCADELIGNTTHIDVLINNAGATFTSRAITPEGFEQTFAVNYVGHYVLTRLLLGHLNHVGGSRVISVSSDGHKFVRGIRWDDLTFARRYSTISAYANAKLAQVLFTQELARRAGDSGVLAHAVHPGFVGSNFYTGQLPGFADRAAAAVIRAVARSPEQGAATPVFLASADIDQYPNGGYWAFCKPAKPSRAAADSVAASRLWDLTAELVSATGTELPVV